MGEKTKVSVVVPVYNAERTLAESLKDIVNQTLADIEILCVDDGSTDQSPAIIREFMEKDSRIHLFQQQNQYAGAARNYGMERANGKYIVFWDADDWFDSSTLEKLYLKAEEEESDITICNIRKLDDVTGKYVLPSNYLRKEFMPDQTPFSVQDIPQYIFNFTTNIPWNKLYRREFIREHKLRFEHRKRANDVVFVMNALYLARRISVVDERLITYRTNSQGSLTATLADEIFSTYDAYLAAHESLKEKQAFDNEKVLQSFANKALNMIIQSIDLQNNEKSLKTLFDMLLKEGFDKLDITDRGADYYYSEKVYKVYHTMLLGSIIDTLIEQKNQKEANLEGHRQRLCEQRQKNKELREKNSALQEKLRIAEKRNLVDRVLKKCKLMK